MNKKDSIRTYLLNAKDEYHFTAASLAANLSSTGTVRVTEKDVGNVTRELLKSGALSRTQTKAKEFVYTVDQKAMTFHFVKHPIRDLPPREGKKAKPEGGFFGDPLPTRRHNRPPMVRAIDDEIAMHKGKIKKLELWRKEYMA